MPVGVRCVEKIRIMFTKELLLVNDSTETINEIQAQVYFLPERNDQYFYYFFYSMPPPTITGA